MTLSNYSVQDRGLLAVYLACRKWRCCLGGKETVVYTDHQPLKYLHNQPNPNKRQVRWIEQLEELSLIYNYQPGRENTVPDALSCIPTYSSSSATDYSSEIACLVYRTYLTKVPMLLEYIKGDKELLV